MTLADDSSRSSSWMRPSTKACSVFASSYSALSTVSLNSLARRIRLLDLVSTHSLQLVQLGGEALLPLRSQIDDFFLHASRLF